MWPVAVGRFLAVGGDMEICLGLGEALGLVLTPVAGVSDEGFCRGADVGGCALQHRFQRLHIRMLVAHPQSHDLPMIAIPLTM